MKLALVLTALTWAIPANAEVKPSDADVAAVIAVVEANGCVVKAYDDPVLLQESKIDAETAMVVIGSLVENSTISVTHDVMRLTTPACLVTADAAPSAPVPERAAFVALLEAHDCKLAFADAEKLFSEAGFTPQTANAIADALAAEGQLELGPNEMTLKSGNCQ